MDLWSGSAASPGGATGARHHDTDTPPLSDFEGRRVEAQNAAQISELAAVLQQLRADSAAGAVERAQLHDHTLELGKIVAHQQAALDEHKRVATTQSAALEELPRRSSEELAQRIVLQQSSKVRAEQVASAASKQADDLAAMG